MPCVHKYRRSVISGKFKIKIKNLFHTLLSGYTILFLRYRLSIFIFFLYTERSANQKGRCSSGRAVFTVAQKNWLEYYFQMEKYISKPNRKTLASSLGLTDLQVSVWFYI